MSALAVARSSFATSLARYRRSWGLWLLLLIAPVSARYWIADKDSASAAIVINGKAPMLTSAVLGVSLGIVVATIFLPAAFIYLRTNTTRHQSWQIEETTPASRMAMSFGRFGADSLVLAVMLAAMTLAGWLLAWVVQPIDGTRLIDIILGLWLTAAPTLMIVAAVRIAFDSLRITRGALGDIMFFLLWFVSIFTSLASTQDKQSYAGAMKDFAGYVSPLAEAFPAGKDTTLALGRSPAKAGRIAVDAKSGLVSENYIASRLSWAGLAVLLVALAGVVYRPHRPGARRSLLGWIARLIALGPPRPAQADAPSARYARAPWLGAFVGEFRLIAQGRIWLLLALGVALLGWTRDFMGFTNPAALLLLIFGVSAHAGRSEQSGLLALTRTMLVPPNLRRAIFVLAGVAWSLAIALPAIAKAALAGNFAPLAVSLTTGAFTAVVAIVLGSWARSAVAPRLVLLIAWYAWISPHQ